MEPGTLVAGKYRVERVLGEGGMGVVVEATHLELDQRFAIKYLRPEATAIPEAVQRFLREAKSAVKLRSEHVARVIDVGTDDGVPYMVMELLIGKDLAAVATHGPLEPRTAVGYVLQVCEAVAEAHSLGIVHRDLKPSNLFLTDAADGSDLVKVLDFGISKARPKHEDFSLTRTSSLMGSPGYMSPEQLRAPRDVDARSDVWSLGVVLFELVEGRVPFDAEHFSELCIKVAMDPTPPLLRAPPGLAMAIARCLEKDPDQRWPDVAELAAGLAPFGPPGATASAAKVRRLLAGRSRPLSTPAAPPVSRGHNTLDAASGSVPTQPPPRRGAQLAAALAAITVSAAALLIWLISNRSGTATSAPDGAPPARVVAPAAAPAPAPAPVVPAAVVVPPDAGVPSPEGAAAPATPPRRPVKKAGKKPADMYDTRN